jgi:hypothetical protein
MRDGGGGFPPAAMRQFSKEIIRKRARDVGEGVAVEEKKRSVPVAGAEKAKRLAGAGF